MDIFSIDTIGLVLGGCLVVCFFIQIFYYLFFYAKPLFYQNKLSKNEIAKQTIDSYPGVSVIITAKNESKNLTEFLPSILSQDYKNFEVIIINDGSTDESEDILGELEQKYSNLYKTYIPASAKGVSHKKLALTVGIKAAKHDILLFTEANNEPVSKDWIKSMAGNFNKETEIVLGFSKLNNFGFVSKLAGFDNLLCGLKYLSRAIVKRPYMGVGNNLAYRKELFFSKKGFSKWLNLQFGEDDLFVNESANSTNTRIEISKQSITQTNIESFKIWKDIKICREVTQDYYKGSEVGMWRIESGSRFLFWGLTIAIGILYWDNLLISGITAILFITKFVVQYLIINKSAKMLLVKPYGISLLLFDFIQPVFNFYFYLYGVSKGKNDYIWR
ncbi:MAG: glycosyltransferase [Dysgonamonadaceae bacterium]|jgi:glycosyltransferase involved in cell wall biosynthesis|nr:glycosyltransferase [Dysgonamonadaceae bacterium]